MVYLCTMGTHAITISDRKKIGELQEEFTRVFPYLRLEISDCRVTPGQAGAGDDLQTSRGTAPVPSENNKAIIMITPQTTVSSLEKNFRELFGLCVQVFRKSGRVWLKTTLTDHWTLQQQSLQAEALSNFGT